MASDQPQDPAGFALIAADGFPDLQRGKIDHHHPSRSENVDMRGWVVVGVDHDPQAVDVQDRGHS